MRRKLYPTLLFVAVIILGLYLKTACSSNDYSPTAVAAIEKQRGLGFVSYMIHEHPSEKPHSQCSMA
ncbi:hypothetical protein [Bacillus sp. FJAT-26390]|uniref:hypothetical protein n=1 Tax=Bacillus sp. FJAT-26390 TaxID=1743142 RepID=UPI0011466DDA|nr:hypothetical protein [Bacillus sp. FJAT-26390]